MFGKSLSTGAGVDVSFGVTVTLPPPAAASIEVPALWAFFWSNKSLGTRNGLKSFDTELAVALPCCGTFVCSSNIAAFTVRGTVESVAAAACVVSEGFSFAGLVGKAARWRTAFSSVVPGVPGGGISLES